MNDAWLTCNIFAGMFSDEVGVLVSPKGGDSTSFFVPKSFVQGDVNQQGKVRVRVYRDGQTAWVVLPTDMKATIPVRESDLAGA